MRLLAELFGTLSPCPRNGRAADPELPADMLEDTEEPPSIDLNPRFQREFVWKEAAVKLLIDSLFRNSFIPPVIFNRVVRDPTKLVPADPNEQEWEEDGEDEEKLRLVPKKTYVCCDVKQRLTAIRQ